MGRRGGDDSRGGAAATVGLAEYAAVGAGAGDCRGVFDSADVAGADGDQAEGRGVRPGVWGELRLFLVGAHLRELVCRVRSDWIQRADILAEAR